MSQATKEPKYIMQRKLFNSQNQVKKYKHSKDHLFHFIKQFMQSWTNGNTEIFFFFEWNEIH